MVRGQMDTHSAHAHECTHDACIPSLTPRRPRLKRDHTEREANQSLCLPGPLSLLPCPWASGALQISLGTPYRDRNPAMFPNFFGSLAGQEGYQAWQ